MNNNGKSCFFKNNKRKVIWLKFYEKTKDENIQGITDGGTRRIKVNDYWFLKGTVCCGYMYFFVEKDGVLMRYAMDSNETELVLLKYGFDYRGSSVLCSDEDKGYVYAAIEFGNSIMQYNVNTGEVKHFEINYGNDLLHLNVKAIIENDEMIIFPLMSNKVIRWKPNENCIQEVHTKEQLAKFDSIYYASNEDNTVLKNKR